ncbi:hypothetical protein AB0D30_38490 [Streptomyces sp. NPDC048409]|uniref:hypothetical protein n=1 Tax=Streptomyces sp. NPDC048409 TaxID=3154723 RepID=UPI00344653D0
MTIHVCPSTIDEIARRVDARDGVYLIKNATVKALENKDRLRMERLRRVYRLLNDRGLNCYPENPSWPDEWWRFVVYRREILAVDLTRIAKDSELMTSLEHVLAALRYPYLHEKAPGTVRMRDALRMLNTAKAEQSEPPHRHLSVA